MKEETATVKPLHVRVAEALGCKTGRRYGEWSCECAPSYQHQNEGVDGAPGEGDSLLYFDTDWSATGPLIEKYRLYAVPFKSGEWVAAAGTMAFHATGPTPLIAVCRLLVELGKEGKL